VKSRPAIEIRLKQTRNCMPPGNESDLESYTEIAVSCTNLPPQPMRMIRLCLPLSMIAAIPRTLQCPSRWTSVCAAPKKYLPVPLNWSFTGNLSELRNPGCCVLPPSSPVLSSLRWARSVPLCPVCRRLLLYFSRVGVSAVRRNDWNWPCCVLGCSAH